MQWKKSSNNLSNESLYVNIKEIIEGKVFVFKELDLEILFAYFFRFIDN